jgi:hypothetical protein
LAKTHRPLGLVVEDNRVRIKGEGSSMNDLVESVRWWSADARVRTVVAIGGLVITVLFAVTVAAGQQAVPGKPPGKPPALDNREIVWPSGDIPVPGPSMAGQP